MATYFIENKFVFKCYKYSRLRTRIGKWVKAKFGMMIDWYPWEIKPKHIDHEDLTTWNWEIVQKG